MAAMKIKNQKGAALVEFTLSLPLLLLLFVGVAEVGLLLYDQQILTNACREGARAGIARFDVEEIVLSYCKAENSGTDTQEWKLLNLVTVNRTSPRVLPLSAAGDFQDDFTVTVEYDYNFLFTKLLGFDAVKTLTAQTTMKVEKEVSTP